MEKGMSVVSCCQEEVEESERGTTLFFDSHHECSSHDTATTQFLGLELGAQLLLLLAGELRKPRDYNRFAMIQQPPDGRRRKEERQPLCCSRRKFFSKGMCCYYGQLLLVVWALVLSTLACSSNTVDGFVVVATARRNFVMIHRTNNNQRIMMSAHFENDNSSGGDNEASDDFGDYCDTGGVIIEDLNWRVAKLRLEEANTKRFLKSSARFLPYDECRRWVQAWGLRWETAEDWREWIAMGEKRNSYIPSRPDEYYQRTGDWISWDHFLLIPPSPLEEEDSDRRWGR